MFQPERIHRWVCRAVLLLAVQFTACTSPSLNERGSKPQEIAIGSKGPVQGIGIGGHDIAAMTNQMARDLFSSPQVMGDGSEPPRIIIDSSHFEIQGSQPINRDLISQRLLVELNRAASGRITFVGRRHLDIVDEEVQVSGEDHLKSDAQKRALGADFRMAGTFGTLDSFDARSGVQQRYNQIVFELIDVRTSAVVWTGMYEVERAAADDIVYR